MKPFDRKIGIVGGGQLGKMLIESSRKWNVEYAILEEANAPSRDLAKEHIVGNIKSKEGIESLAAISDVLTYEIENIHVEALLEVEENGKRVIPSAKVLEIIRDKGIQKQFYLDNGIQTAPFVRVDSPGQWVEAAKQIKGDNIVLKSCTGGYDGKGVKVLSKSDLSNPEIQSSFNQPCILEECIPFEKELAVIVGIDANNNALCFPTVEMEFHPVANLVEFLFSPAEISPKIEEEAKALAMKTALALGSPGLFAIEMFLTKTGQVLVNETAPRPHNSGHHTIEGCVTSQYEQLNRILLGLPLGDTSLRRPTAMINLIGDAEIYGAYALTNMDELMSMEGVHLHLYNKQETKPFRKLGHVTLEADSVEALKRKAKKVLTLLQLEHA